MQQFCNVRSVNLRWMMQESRMDEENPIAGAGKHLFIAGTGRAGTSFLVRYLNELGLDTHLGRHAAASGWDENANAGLEDAPFLGTSTDLPYVVKFPYLYACIDELIASGTFRPDAVIIPIRDLAEAAISRSVVERRAVHQSAVWMSERDSSWEQWAHVPGGIIYSLNPIDQGRLLAVGFHHLVQRLVAADIPIVFIAFPRLIEDGRYLFNKLRPLLPPTANETSACAAHERLADTAKVRVGPELTVTERVAQPHTANVMSYPSHAALDAIALRRELRRLRRQISEMHNQVARSAEQFSQERLAAGEEMQRQLDTVGKMEAALAEATASGQQLRHENKEATEKIVQLLEQSALDRREAVEVMGTLARIYASFSWRITRPYRRVGFVARQAIRWLRVSAFP
jgi:hypothetical protein